MKILSSYITSFLEMMGSERGASNNTIESYSSDLEMASLYFKGQTIEQIETKDIKKYIEVLNIEYSRSSVSRKISVLKQFFEYLMSEKEISYNPTRVVGIPKKEAKIPKFLTEGEIGKMLSAIKSKSNDEALRIKAIILILSGSGLRVSELISLKTNSIQKVKIDNKEHFFLQVKGKGDKERIAPLTNGAKEILDKYIQFLDSDNPWLFPSTKNRNKPITRQQVANLLKKYAIQADISPEKISPHILRHSFATNILNKGIDLRSLQEILGHSDISTTQIYTHLNVPQLKNFVEENHPVSDIKN